MLQAQSKSDAKRAADAARLLEHLGALHLGLRLSDA